MNFYNALTLAKSRILPKGYKPEDYFMVDPKLPFKIAKLILKEALHIIQMNKLYNKIGCKYPIH